MADNSHKDVTAHLLVYLLLHSTYRSYTENCILYK